MGSGFGVGVCTAPTKEPPGSARRNRGLTTGEPLAACRPTASWPSGSLLHSVVRHAGLTGVGAAGAARGRDRGVRLRRLAFDQGCIVQTLAAVCTPPRGRCHGWPCRPPGRGVPGAPQAPGGFRTDLGLARQHVAVIKPFGVGRRKYIRHCKVAIRVTLRDDGETIFGDAANSGRAACPFGRAARLVERAARPSSPGGRVLEPGARPSSRGARLLERAARPSSRSAHLLDPAAGPSSPGVRLARLAACRCEPGADLSGLPAPRSTPSTWPGPPPVRGFLPAAVGSRPAACHCTPPAPHTRPSASGDLTLDGLEVLIDQRHTIGSAIALGHRAGLAQLGEADKKRKRPGGCKEFTYPSRLCGDGSASRSADGRIAYHFAHVGPGDIDVFASDDRGATGQQKVSLGPGQSLAGLQIVLRSDPAAESGPVTAAY